MHARLCMYTLTVLAELRCSWATGSTANLVLLSRETAMSMATPVGVTTAKALRALAISGRYLLRCVLYVCVCACVCLFVSIAIRKDDAGSGGASGSEFVTTDFPYNKCVLS